MSELAHAPTPTILGAAARSEQVWFGRSDRPLYGWLSSPEDGLVRGGVVLCPPMGEEGRAAHRTFRRAAESLAEAGLAALRIDYDGTGDSAGRQDDPERVSAWLQSITAARDFLTALGVAQVSVVGMRLGATLVAEVAATGTFEDVVLWDPCGSGKTFLREGQALHTFSGLDRHAEPDGLVHTPGFQYDAATVTALHEVDLSRLDPAARIGRRVLLLERPDRPLPARARTRLQAEAERLTVDEAPDQAMLLDLPPSECFVPERSLTRTVNWLVEGVRDRPTTRLLPVASGPAVVIESDGPGSARVTEQSVHLGAGGIYGIVTEPLEPSAAAPWVVLVNVAAEHHIGPGRRWVELARQWAALGFRCVRIDHTGVGDSPTRPGQVEDDPYSPEWIEDAREVVRELGADGAPVVMFGLCSGAYSSLEASMWEPVDAVVALNPRLSLFPASKGTGRYTALRRAAVVPPRPIAAVVRRWRKPTEWIWRSYRQVAIWHSPVLVLRRVLAQGTTLRVVSNPADARDLTDVAFWWPLLWLMRRRSSLRFDVDSRVDHSLLTRTAQDTVQREVTAFLVERYGPDRR